MKTSLRVICLFLCSVIIWFLTDAAHIRAAAAQGLALCAGSVIPALFPFLVISRLLVSLGFATWISPLLRNIVTPLFRLPGIAGSALLLGLIGGYPIGAQTAADLYRTGQLTRQETERLLSFCNNSNPVFLISVLGLGVFGSIRCGVWLWLIHLLSALLTGIFLRRKPALSHRTLPPSVSPPSGFAYCFVSAVRDSALAMLNVCAFVVLFYVLVSPFKTLPPKACAMLTGMTELFSLIPQLKADRFSFILASGCAGWGGLSVLAQTAAALDQSGLSLRSCLLGKALQGLLSGLLAAVFVPYLL